MEAYGLIINIVIIGFGVYALYIWYNQKNGEFVDNNKLLLPGATKANCENPEEYMKEMNPILLAGGIISIVYGAFDMSIEKFGILNHSIQMVFIILYVVCLFWVARKLQKVNRKYWPNL